MAVRYHVKPADVPLVSIPAPERKAKVKLIHASPPAGIKMPEGAQNELPDPMPIDMLVRVTQPAVVSNQGASAGRSSLGKAGAPPFQSVNSVKHTLSASWWLDGASTKFELTILTGTVPILYI